jgi:transitional endoplasmic reticulum ATPase
MRHQESFIMSRSYRRFMPSFIKDMEIHETTGAYRQSVHSLLGYALNVMRSVEAASQEAEALVCWLSRNRQRLGVPDTLFIAADSKREDCSAKVPAIDKERWRAFNHAISECYFTGYGNSASADDETSGTIEAGLCLVTTALGFDELDAALFGVIFHYRSDSAFDRLFDALATARGRAGILRRYPDLFALLVGAQTADVNPRFRADSQLLVSGAISIDEDGGINLATRLGTLVEQCAEGNCDIRTELLGKPMDAKLPFSAFRHLGREIEVAFAILHRALQAANTEQPEHGVHILLYGPPGTGKTECAQSLAEELGVALHVVGEQSENGQEPSRAERLSSLLLAQRIGAAAPAMYLFDEAEDLFRPSTRDRELDPKIFVHRLLETARVPMIWAANDLTAFSPAVLRRMSMCIEVRLPNQSRRAELWQELAKAENVVLDAQTASRLARLIPSAPSVARTALRAARLGDGMAETVALVASGMARAIGHGCAVTPEPEIESIYDPALSNADRDLADLTARLTRAAAPRAISLLLSGPPGTGKTAYSRHLAARMGLEVIQKRGSDIFDPYVGETEANIAAAFAEARATGAFLLFDEADSLLFDRSNAVRGWELSQVNEMLTWMEQHPLPIACTTNLAERLDKASLRRFLVRLNFDFLRTDQAALLFRRSFAIEPPAALARLDRLTPADFSRIARRCAALDTPLVASALVEMLAAEIEGRDGTARPIGFARRVPG